jgi:DNA-binding PadR family transcriptional regulator
MPVDALRGYLKLLLLAAVRARPSHGYDIVQELRRRTEGLIFLGDGTIYTALHRLEAAGLITSHLHTIDGRTRRVYTLTKDGIPEFERQVEDWRRFSSAMNSMLAAAA